MEDRGTSAIKDFEDGLHLSEMCRFLDRKSKVYLIISIQTIKGEIKNIIQFYKECTANSKIRKQTNE